MNDKVAKLSGGMVWLFALAAIVLGIGGGYATAGLGAKVSSGVFFAVFAVAGYLAALMTRASKGVAVLAFVFASFAVAGTYYLVVSKVVADAAGGAQGAGSLGALFGAFIAAVTLIATLVAGVGGVLAGSKARVKLTTGG